MNKLSSTEVIVAKMINVEIKKDQILPYEYTTEIRSYRDYLSDQYNIFISDKYILEMINQMNEELY